MNAREVATEVLRRVACDGAWASPTLDAELARAELSSRDASLVTAIVYGALRVLPSLDRAIDAHAQKTDPFVRAALRAATFQLHHLERVPSHAVVDETVTLVRRIRGKPVSGFVNAVLRKIARADSSPSTTLEMPEWITTALEKSVGPDRANVFRSESAIPPLDLRAARDRSRVLTDLSEGAYECWPIGERGVRILNAGDPRNLPGFDEGEFYVQEYGSQLIVDLVAAHAGEHVVDACAGRGGKTLGLLDAVTSEGSVTAIELHEKRLEKIPAAAARHAFTAALNLEAIDLTVGNGGLGEFDRVLVDAPCSGLGTVVRRPEILLRIEPEDIEALVATQAKILRNAATLVRPGGTLVFAVCSFLDEEGSAHREVLDWPLDPPAAADADGCVRLGPWQEPTSDAYQVLRWTRPT